MTIGRNDHIRPRGGDFEKLLDELFPHLAARERGELQPEPQMVKSLVDVLRDRQRNSDRRHDAYVARMDRVLSDARTMAKSAATMGEEATRSLKRSAIERRDQQRAEARQKFQDLRARIDEGIADGSLTALQVSRLELELNRVAERIAAL